MAVETISIVYAVMGGFILVYGVLSLVIKERLYMSEAFVAVVIGILFGPVCANLINIDTWGIAEEDLTREFSRFVIAIQVTAAGVALPGAYLKKEFASLAMLLVPGMIWMWLLSGLSVWAVVPGLNFLESLMIASCFTPTDPILANSIVHGKFAEERVPRHIRDLISAESGANDGLGYPFLFLAIYLMQMSPAPAVGKWFYWILCFEILLSIVIGLVVGFVAKYIVKQAEVRVFMDKESFLVYAIAIALFLLGVVSLIGSDDLLACFVAGNAFTWDDWFREETGNAHLMEVVDMLLNLSVFVYIGATVPWAKFVSIISIWRLFVLAIMVLLLRRVPIIMALYKFIPSIRTWQEALFTGWFGPIGVGAIFYYTVAIENLNPEGKYAYAYELIQPIVYFMVLASVVVHGVTVPMLMLGKVAGRTLSRTSSFMSSSSNLFRIQQRKRNNGDEIKSPLPPPPAHTASAPPRQTAITIVTPDLTRTSEPNSESNSDVEYIPASKAIV